MISVLSCVFLMSLDDQLPVRSRVSSTIMIMYVYSDTN